MEVCRKQIDHSAALSSDSEHIYRKYETAILALDCNSLPLKVGRAIKAKIKTDQSTFRGLQTEFLSHAFQSLEFNRTQVSNQAVKIGEFIESLFKSTHSPEDLISIIISVEENLAITRVLLKAWSVDHLKKRNSHSQYRNSSLKLFFDLNQNLNSIQEMKNIETEEGVSESNDKTTELTDLFFDWWKLYYTIEKIEESIL